MRFPFARNTRGTALVHPLDPAPRTAILIPGFRETRTVRTFASGWTKGAVRFHPTVVAGPLSALLDLARCGIRLKHAIIVFSPDFNSCLTQPSETLFGAHSASPCSSRCSARGTNCSEASAKLMTGCMYFQARLDCLWTGRDAGAGANFLAQSECKRCNRSGRRPDLAILVAAALLALALWRNWQTRQT